MINKLRGYTQLAFSVVMLCAIAFAMAIISYQLFSPQGRIFQALGDLWDNHPMVLLVLVGAVLVARHWINGSHPGQHLSNGLFYLTAIIGIVAGMQYFS